MNVPDERQAANRFADRIESQIRKMGRWREGPAPGALNELYLVLQYGLAQRLRENGLPKSSNISTLAYRELDQPNEKETLLIEILQDFDDFVKDHAGQRQETAASAAQQPMPNATVGPSRQPVETTNIEVELPDGRREVIAVLKGMEEQVRKAYAEMSPPRSVAPYAAVKTCPHLEPLERAVNDAIQAASGRFEAQGFELQGPSESFWGCPGPGWRCYQCAGGRAESYLDTASLRSRLHLFSPPVQYEEFTEPRSNSASVVFSCHACRCAIVGTQPPPTNAEGFEAWRLVIA